MTSETEPQGPPSEAELQELLYNPLGMIKNVSNRLLSRDIPFSGQRLESLYAHIATAVDEVLEFARGQLDQGLQSALEAAREAGDELGESEAAESMHGLSEEFELARETIGAALDQLRTGFFAASNFSELQARTGFLELAEGQLQAGLQRLESALQLADDPKLWSAGQVVVAEPVGKALNCLADTLENLQSHLEDGRREHLETALKELDAARALIVAALQS